MMREYFTIPLLLFVCFFISVCTNEQDPAENRDAELSLEKVHEWQINEPEHIPFPRFASALDDGSLIVIDGSLHTINHIGGSGEIIRVLGGAGNGPGEAAQLTAAAISPDGRVAIADLGNARVTITDVYDGSLNYFDFDPGWNTRLQWIENGLVILNHPFLKMQSDPGDIFMRYYDAETGEKEEFYQYELVMQDSPPEQLSCTFCAFRFLDDRSFISAPSDTSYRIVKVNTENGSEQLIRRPNVMPVKFTEDERESRRNSMAQQGAVTGIEINVEIPEYKRRFLDYFPDHEGRIWAMLNPEVDGTPHFDIFSVNGDYLGSIALPQGSQSVLSRSDDQLLIRYTEENPELWRAGLYRITE